MKDVHGGNVKCSDTVILKDKINGKFVPNVKSDQYVIVGCGKVFKNDDVKVLHIHKEHIAGSFTCYKCGAFFKSMDNLKNHSSGRTKKNSCS